MVKTKTLKQVRAKQSVRRKANATESKKKRKQARIHSMALKGNADSGPFLSEADAHSKEGKAKYKSKK